MVLGCVGRFSLSIVGEAYVLSMRVELWGMEGQWGTGIDGHTDCCATRGRGARLRTALAFAHGSCVGGGERGVRMRDPDDDAESYLASAGRGAAGRE